MSITRRISALIAAVSLCGAASAQEGTLKIATVDMQQLFKEYHRTDEAQTEINVERARIQKDNNDRQTTIRDLDEQLQKLRAQLEDPALSGSRKDSLVQEYTAKQQEGVALDRERREFLQRRNQMLNERMVQRMKGILEEIRKLVVEKAKAEDFDYVFDKSGLSASQVPFFLVSPDSSDVTEDLLKELNKDAPAKVEGAPSAPAVEPTE